MNINSHFLRSMILLLISVSSVAVVTRNAHAQDTLPDSKVSQITRALVRGDLVRANNRIQEALENYPDHPSLLAAKVRYLMLTEREPSNSPLGYRYTERASGMMQTALDTALKKDSAHRQALYLQAELSVTQGDLLAAGKALQVAREQGIDDWSLKYIESKLQIMQEQPSVAIRTLQPILYAKSMGADRAFIFQQAWDQVKIVGMKHPEHDPLSLVREGLMVRVSSKDLIEEITQRSKSEKPLVVIINSEDPRCGPCVNKGEEIAPYVSANQDKYNFIYTSIEPWQNIAYQDWRYMIPRMKGVPVSAVFAKSQFMTTGQLPIGGDMTSRFNQLYTLLPSQNPGVIDYKAKMPYANKQIAYAQWWAIRGKTNAFASVTTDDNYAWGSVTKATKENQEQVNQEAMKLCAESAANKGIDKPCELSAPRE